MTTVASPSTTKSTIMPALRYADASAAIEWLCSVLGFKRHVVCEGANGTIDHAELSLQGGMVMLGSQKQDQHGERFENPIALGGKETASIYVVVADAEAGYERAQSAGASITRAIETTHYGSREFTVQDPEGHTWTLGTYDPWGSR